MPNMSYCRFRNTSEDLQDCLNHIDEVDDLNQEEKEAREKLIELCVQIADDYGEKGE